MSNLDSLSIKELKRLMARDIVRVKINPYYDNKEMDHLDVTELEEFQPFKPLLDKPISISEASRRYGIKQQTISRWVKNGHIKKIGMDKNRILIDEGYISYFASKYKKIAKSGRRTDYMLFE